MSDAATRAPIRYTDVRIAYNTVRAAGGLTIVALALIFWLTQGHVSVYTFIGGGAIVADAVYRRQRVTSALPVLAVDAAVIGFLTLLAGQGDSSVVGPFVYILTASLLLLPQAHAALILAFAAVWLFPAMLWAPLTASAGSQTAGELNRFVAFVFVAIVARLLLVAIEALHSASEQHEHALESERRAAALKDEFVSMVSHELRTPLTSIEGFTDTLHETWENLSHPEIDEFLTIVKRESTHLSNLVEDILVIPRLEAGRLRLEENEFDLRDLIFETASMLFIDDERNCEVSIPGGVMAHADQGRVKQIMRNLLENARKYGGDQVLVDGEMHGDLYRITVADNGPGIPEADRDRIFEHFEQLTKGDGRLSQGVGLGLPIARKLARAMGGDLWFSPRFPTGSLFHITVPLTHHVLATTQMTYPLVRED
jgi:signal transduction histidine kinase